MNFSIGWGRVPAWRAQLLVISPMARHTPMQCALRGMPGSKEALAAGHRPLRRE